MTRRNGRKHGEVFTNMNVVQFILDEAGYSSELNLKELKILEPASGSGAFATEILKRLYKSSLTFNFSFIDRLVNNLTFVELDKTAFLILTKTIDELVFELTKQKLNISSEICINTNFLIHEFNQQYEFYV